MPDTPSISLVKRFLYRGSQEDWSNTYHFTGTTPADDAAWRALALAIYTTEKACYTSATKLVTAYGYEAGNEHSVAQIDFTTGTDPGTGTLLAPVGTVGHMAGDQAGWIRAKIGVSSTGKKVYIRKYFHDGTVGLTTPDQLAAATATAYTAHAAALLSGSLPGGAKWSGPQAQAATLPVTGPYVTTRTLKRRGKRP